MDSWKLSDTVYDSVATAARQELGYVTDPEITCREQPLIGPNDMKLACKLIKGGSVHRKFMRQIVVSWDITIPRYLWQELDTYKVATVRNSCSTMHKLGHRDLERADFQSKDVSRVTLEKLNAIGVALREKTSYTDPDTELTYEGDGLLAHMKRRLPEGFLQMATYLFNYENALGIYRWRHNHRMPEWSAPGGICDWLLRLPYFPAFLKAFSS